MASVAARHVGKMLAAADQRRSSPASSSFATINGFRSPLRAARVSRQATAVAAVSCTPVGPRFPIQTGRILEPNPTNPIKETLGRDEIRADLDRWIKSSVTEIVRNVGEAPLLLQIYGDGTGTGLPSNSSDGLRIVTEKAVEQNWPMIAGRWEGGNCKGPNGIILVEELKCNEEDNNPNKTLSGNSNNGQSQRSKGTKAWGLLI